MGEMSPWHWAVVIVVLVVLFGARRLPDAARSLGRSARILKAELRSDGADGGDGPDPPATPGSAETTVTSPQRDPRHD